MNVRETVWHGDRGDGSIFFRLDRNGARISPNLYLSYRADGKEHMRSAKTAKLSDAKNELKRLTRNRANAQEGLDVLKTPKAERLTVSDLLDSMLTSAREKNLASLSQIEYRTETLRGILGNIRATVFGSAHVTFYKKARNGKVSDTSVRKELEILTHAFRLAVRRGQLRVSPEIEKPTEDNVRTEALTPEQWRDVLAAMKKHSPDAADFAEFQLLTMRRPKTIRGLRWADFDPNKGEVLMPSSKRGKAAWYPMTGLLAEVFKRRIAARVIGCDAIFHRGGRAWDARGDQVRKVFNAAMKDLGLPYGRKEGCFSLYSAKHTGLSAGRDAGIEQAALMDLSGHRTDSAFRRYVVENTDNRRRTLATRDADFTKRFEIADQRATGNVTPIRA